MITLYNNNYGEPNFEAAYEELFAKAHEDLVKYDASIKPFTGLDDYFSHIGDLIKINPIYAMLPLDEAPFKIDANTRSVSIPAEFKYVGVQNDNLCEIITFTIDRYFDYVDLERTTIAIQWQSPKNKGIHIIDLIDIDTYPGKIRFGWPLTSDITEEPGDVIFSVRFFIRPESGGEPKYILNTSPAKISIRPTLIITDPDVVEETNISTLFQEFVQNSIHSSGERPLSPHFGVPGKDLETYGALINDELVLRVQAISGDNGNISYKWYYKSSAAPAEETALLVQTGDNYIVDNECYEVIKWDKDTNGKDVKKRVPGEKYYYHNPEGPIEYPPFTDAVFDEKTPTLYERFSTLTIKPGTGAVITGDYWVVADNQVSNNVSSKSSTKCNVPAPMRIEEEQKPTLPNHIFLEKNSKLSIKLPADEAKPNYSYTWKKRGVEEAVKEDGGVNIRETEFTPTEAGHYSVNCNIDLNRTVEDFTTNECKVTYMPQPPVFKELLQNDGENEINILNQEAIPTYGPSKFITLTVNTDLDEADEYLTEGLTYQWWIQIVDGPFVEVDQTHVQAGYVAALSNNKTLTVQTQTSLDGAYAVKCLVTNTIQNESKTADSGATEVFTVAWKAQQQVDTEEV